jgi:hypothetical protein
MPRFKSWVGGSALLALAACRLEAERQQEHAPRPAEEVFERSLPDTEAGAALQAKLGDARLAGPDKQIEREAFELLAREEDALVDDYVSQHGTMVNTDEARELFPAYRADRSRAAAVHEPSSELSRKVYAKLLDENRGKVGEVVFLAGGAGSGKTTAVKRMSLDQPGRDVITFDGTFSNPGANMERIRQALGNGYEVSLVYIHVDDSSKALANALDRAERMAAEMGSGRPIRATDLVEQHANARQAFVDATEELKSDPRASFRVIENSGTPDESSSSVKATQRSRSCGRDYTTTTMSKCSNAKRKILWRTGSAPGRSPRGPTGASRGFSGRAAQDEELGVVARPSAGDRASRSGEKARHPNSARTRAAARAVSSSGCGRRSGGHG